MAKVPITVKGVTVEAERMAFIPTDEPWSSFRLDDGTTVKVKLVVSDILRLPQKDELTGLHQYVVRSTNVATVVPPEKKGGGH